MEITKPVKQYYSVVYLIDNKTDEIFYLRKHSPNMPQFNGKLVGWGGKVELGEDYVSCAKRELKEELDLDVEKEDLIFQGEFYDGVGGYVFVYKYYLKKRLEEKYYEGEGEGKYYDMGFHKTFPKEFPEKNLLIEEAIYFDATFKIQF